MVTSLRKALVMGNGKDGTPLSHLLPEEGEHLICRVRVQCRSRLVHHQQRFLHHGGYGNHNALPLSAGDFIHAFVVHFFFQPQFCKAGKEFIERKGSGAIRFQVERKLSRQLILISTRLIIKMKDRSWKLPRKSGIRTAEGRLPKRYTVCMPGRISQRISSSMKIPESGS